MILHRGESSSAPELNPIRPQNTSRLTFWIRCCTGRLPPWLKISKPLPGTTGSLEAKRRRGSAPSELMQQCQHGQQDAYERGGEPRPVRLDRLLDSQSSTGTGHPVVDVPDRKTRIFDLDLGPHAMQPCFQSYGSGTWAAREPRTCYDNLFATHTHNKEFVRPLLSLEERSSVLTSASGHERPTT